MNRVTLVRRLIVAGALTMLGACILPPMPPGGYGQTGTPTAGGGSSYYGGQGYGGQAADDQGLQRDDQQWQAQQRQQQLAADRETNRTVTVTINGAVIGPADQNGMAWDGPGLSPDAVSFFADVVVKQFPVGAVPVLGDLVSNFAGDLANSVYASLEQPDPKGTATEAFTGSSSAGASFDLAKSPDTYTPLWNVRIPNVLVHAITIRVDLWTPT